MAHKIPPKVRKSKRLMRHWKYPWRKRARWSRVFRRELNKAGLITPHFSWKDAECSDGSKVPRDLKGKARRHAWDLERFRHSIGDKPIDPISWYRTYLYNRKVGGAGQSKHMQALATDYSKQTIEKVGRAKWFKSAEKIFANGGVGDYPAGSGHLDSRGYRARWRSYVPGR